MWEMNMFLQTSLRGAILPPNFWTLSYTTDEFPTSILSNFPCGVLAPSWLNFRQTVVGLQGGWAGEVAQKAPKLSFDSEQEMRPLKDPTIFGWGQSDH